MDLTRKCLILASPGGENGSENYLHGTIIDAENYSNYFKSTVGGAWNEDEIDVKILDWGNLNKWSLNDSLNNSLNKLKNADFGILIYTGHGCGEDNRNTCLCLAKDFNKLSSKLEQCLPSKGIFIMDCCRNIPSITESIKEASTLNFPRKYEDFYRLYARIMYDDKIKLAEKEIIIAFSCSVDESSIDTGSTGGLYSRELLKAGRNATRNLSFVEAHKIAKTQTQIYTNNSQNPTLTNPTSSLPFAINFNIKDLLTTLIANKIKQ